MERFMNEQPMEAALIGYIKGTILREPHFPLALDTPLIHSGLIDSLALLELAMFIEENFGVTLEDAELEPENFNSIQTMMRLIDCKIAV